MRCNDTRQCFAKKEGYGGRIYCDFLEDGYPNGKCPFCKQKIEDVSYTTLRLRNLKNGGGEKIG